MSLAEKYTFEPNADLTSYNFWTDQVANFWTHHHFRFDLDREHAKDPNVPEGIKRLIKILTGFFLVGDGLIAEDLIPLISKAIEEQNWPKAFGLIFQLSMENIHAAFYSKALTIFPPEEREEILEWSLSLPCTQAKINWLHGRTDIKNSEGLDNIAMACGEGIFFISLFSAVYYIRKYGFFPDFIEGNEKISGDESKHRDDKCAQAKKYLNPEEYSTSLEIVQDAVRVELLTVEEIFKQPVVPGRDEDSDFTSGNVTQYIYHLADDILVKCGLSKYYNVDMDKYSWPWLEDINMSQKSNFYERAVVNSYRVIDPSTVMKEAMGEEEDEDDAFDDLDNFDV